MASKQSNLCVAADVTCTRDLLKIAENVGPHICLLKTHVDILENFNDNFIKSLKDIADKHNFLLFEDRKFADIGKTVELQYSKGIYKISSWANVVTAHSVAGKGALDAIKKSDGLRERGVFLLAETSANGSLITETYTKATLKIASEYSDLITGIVCQNPLFTDKPGIIQLTPGVRLDVLKDDLGQQYNSPQKIILESGADIAVVGRGITQSPKPGVTAEMYKKLLWEAYQQRTT